MGRLAPRASRVRREQPACRGPRATPAIGARRGRQVKPVCLAPKGRAANPAHWDTSGKPARRAWLALPVPSACRVRPVPRQFRFVHDCRHRPGGGPPGPPGGHRPLDLGASDRVAVIGGFRPAAVGVRRSLPLLKLEFSRRLIPCYDSRDAGLAACHRSPIGWLRLTRNLGKCRNW